MYSGQLAPAEDASDRLSVDREEIPVSTEQNAANGERAGAISFDSLGLPPTDKIKRLVRAVGAIGVGYTRLPFAYQIDQASRLLPFAEQDPNTQLTPEQHGIIVDELKRMHPVLGALYKISKVRNIIDRKIDDKYPEQSQQAVEAARKQLEALEPLVDQLAKIENPPEQISNELTTFTIRAIDHIEQQKNMRLGMLDRGEQPPSTSSKRGIMGFAEKIVKFFRRIFRPNRKDPIISREYTAYDVGNGFKSYMDEITLEPSIGLADMPTLQSFVESETANNPQAKFNLPQINLKNFANIPADILALAAPELLRFMITALDTNKPKDSRFISPKNNVLVKLNTITQQVYRNPHNLRFATKYVNRIKRLRYGSENLIPALMDILPTKGQDIRNMYDNVMSLLNNRPSYIEKPISEPAPSPKKHFLSRMRNSDEKPSKTNLLRRIFTRRKHQDNRDTEPELA